MPKEFVSLLPSFMGKYDLAWKILRKIENQLKAVSEHPHTIGYPALEAKLVERLEPLSYEITLKGYDGFAADVAILRKKLAACQSIETSASDAINAFWAVRDEIPVLARQAHKMGSICRDRTIFYFVSGTLIILCGVAWVLNI